MGTLLSQTKPSSTVSTPTHRAKKNAIRIRVQVETTRPDLTVSAFGNLPDDIFMQILLLSDHRSWNALRVLNGHFYHLLDPTKQIVHKIWENKVRSTFPLTPPRFKCKRWDLYYNYKMHKISSDVTYRLERYNYDQIFREGFNPQWMIIEGCDFDINRINKTTQYQASDLWKDGIDEKKNRPKGMDELQLFCPVIAISNFKYLDYIDSETYKCIVCKNTVHSVNSLESAKQKLAEGNCIRVVWTNGPSVFHLGGLSYTDPKIMSQLARKTLQYEWEDE